jgi:hypothetical protein
LGPEPQTDVSSEVARVRVAIDRAAAAIAVTLAGHTPASADDDPLSPLAAHGELCRQLAALRARVALAESRNQGPHALHAELATLLFFAKTLRADADNWRSALQAHIEELERRRTAARKQLERQRTAARQERDRLAAEREKLVGCRDALRLTVLQTAERMAQQYRGECRRTVPVFTLGDGLTVCSMSVSCPRRGFRFPKHWLVTATGSHDVLVRRE